MESNFTARERNILISSCYGHFLSHFNMLIFPALLIPLSLKMNLDIAEVLKLSFYMYMFFGITALPWGMAADKLGAKPLFMIQYLGSGLSSIAAFYYIDSGTGLMISLACIGIFRHISPYRFGDDS